MIGWYVHAHGSGHLHRMLAVADALREPVTVLSSLPRPAGVDLPWVLLPGDLPHGASADVAADVTADVTAGGTLHWAPRHHPGLRARAAAIAGWVEQARPDVVVVDVSVEVAVLVRTMGVPVVVAGMRGTRTDRAHRTAYDLAEAVLAPWPAAFAEPWPQSWLDKTWHVGALSRADGRPVVPPPGAQRVAVLWGAGGAEVQADDVRRAERATPGWSWLPVGVPGTDWVDDPWPVLQVADVVVTHGGQNAVAEVAAARRPAVVLPQPRPYDEQQATGRTLSRAGLAVVAEGGWPAAPAWPGLLAQASALDPAGWSAWSDGDGAVRAARLLEGLCRMTGR